MVLTGRPVYLSDESDAPSVLQLVNLLLRHRRLVVTLSLGVAILAVGLGLMLDVSHTSSGSFMSRSDQGQISRLGGLAAQFGVNLPNMGSGESPQFYADLLRSTHLLSQVVDTRYTAGATDGGEESRTGNLVELYEIEAETPRLRHEAAVERLRNDVTVETVDQTGVVRLSVTAPWPDLAQQVADRLIELVQKFNVEQRQTRAEEERRFLEERVSRARQDLLAAEDSLERFLQRNRRYQDSPPLRFAHDRLQRRVSLQQQVYTSLAQSFEEAKIQAVRNTPVITVVQPPRLPARPDSRNLAAHGVLGLLLGGLVAVFWAFGSRLISDARSTEADSYEEFLRLRRATREDFGRLVRPVRRVLVALREPFRSEEENGTR